MMLANIFIVLPFLLVVMEVNGDDSVLSDSFETKLFAASIACLPSYQTTEDVKCDFNLTNIGDRAYSVLTWNTPLNKLAPKGLAVTRDGKKLKYDGILMKREAPGRRDFVTIAAGENLSSKFDLSSDYDTAKPGTYTVAADIYLEYKEGSVSNIHAAGDTGIHTNLAHLSSPAFSFHVGGKSTAKRTLGHQARSLEGRN
ncbi:hypothetical protein ACROYT_G028101 [Oculina patagonica]